MEMAPLALATIQPVKKKPVEALLRVARVLRLVDDEDDLEAGQHAEATLVQVPKVLTLTPVKELEVEVIEAPLVKRRTLKKVVDVATSEAESAAMVNMANFLVARRKKVPPPSVSVVAEVETFLANEPLEAILVNMVEPVVEEPIQAPGGPIPSVLHHLLGSNIQHILKDIDMESEKSVRMGDDNMGPLTAVVEKTPREPLFPIPEIGASSRAPTPKTPQNSIPTEVDKALRSKRPRTSRLSSLRAR